MQGPMGEPSQDQSWEPGTRGGPSGHSKSKRPPTDTGGERPVPGPALPTQTQQFLTAPQAVSWVTAEGHRASSKMASIVNLVAKLGGSWILTLDEFKTYRREERERVSKTCHGRSYMPFPPSV